MHIRHSLAIQSYSRYFVNAMKLNIPNELLTLNSYQDIITYSRMSRNCEVMKIFTLYYNVNRDFVTRSTGLEGGNICIL